MLYIASIELPKYQVSITKNKAQQADFSYASCVFNLSISLLSASNACCSLDFHFHYVIHFFATVDFLTKF